MPLMKGSHRYALQPMWKHHRLHPGIRSRFFGCQQRCDLYPIDTGHGYLPRAARNLRIRLWLWLRLLNPLARCTSRRAAVPAGTVT